MEKICIVSLRKKIADPVEPGEEQRFVNQEKEYGAAARQSSPQTGRGDPGTDAAKTAGTAGKKEGPAGAVSLALTPEQSRALRENPQLRSLLKANPAGRLEETAQGEHPFVIRFEFEPQGFLRLLKPEEVTQILRISRSYLNGLVGKGTLKSYKVGRLRRFMLDDVLSYLEDNLDDHDLHRDAATTGKWHAFS
jgi:excisionase family DNA binding protein